MMLGQSCNHILNHSAVQRQKRVTAILTLGSYAFLPLDGSIVLRLLRIPFLGNLFPYPSPTTNALASTVRRPCHDTLFGTCPATCWPAHSDQSPVSRYSTARERRSVDRGERDETKQRDVGRRES